MSETPNKIRHPRAHHVFIEKRNYGKWIAHTGISLFVDGDFDTADEAIAACNVKIAAQKLR